MVAVLKDATFTAPSISTGMHVEVTKGDLKRALATLARIADRRSTMPVLGHVAIRVGDDGKVTLAATDLNIWATVEISATFTTDRGGFTVPAKALADIVKKLPGDLVTLRRSRGEWLSVSSGSVETTLLGVNDRDFPRIPDASKTTFVAVDAQTLATMIDRTAFSVCNDETRFHLNGVLLESDGRTARTVSTDGHRLSKYSCEWNGPATKGVIIPKKAVTEIRKLIGKHKGTCEIALVTGTDGKGTTPLVSARLGDTIIMAKPIDAQFPPYEQVIPKDHTKLVTIERKPLIAALERMDLIASETRGVKVSLATGKLELSCDSPDLGTASESLDADFNPRAGGTTFGVNATYVLDALHAIDELHVTITLGSELDPILVRGTTDHVSRSLADAEFVAVVMPMRM